MKVVQTVRPVKQFYFSAYLPLHHRYIGTYVSKHRWDFITYGAYRCDDNRKPRYSRRFRYQCKQPLIGQYASVKNFDLTDPNGLVGLYSQFELDEFQILGKRKFQLSPKGLFSPYLTESP